MHILHMLQGTLCGYDAHIFSAQITLIHSITVWLQGQSVGALSLCAWGDSRTQPM